jgi:hypothetical protein
MVLSQVSPKMNFGEVILKQTGDHQIAKKVQLRLINTRGPDN